VRAAFIIKAMMMGEVRTSETPVYFYTTMEPEGCNLQSLTVF
jgi:hypothetical protein